MYCLVLLSALLACAAGTPLNSAKLRSEGRIVGGTVTDITSHPYQVSVLISGSYRCSGSIISANWVVTSAFCVDWFSLSSVSVRSGSTYSNSGGTLHNATSVIVHESYNYTNYDYDVAVVQVFPAFTFSDSVQPITLECDPVPAGTDVVLTGWGSPSPESRLLQQVTLRTIRDSSCNSTYSYLGGITDRMICARDPIGGKGGCADFGGPLVASNTLVGMYSWAVGCGNVQYPEVYTKVSDLCCWIVLKARLYKFAAVIN